MEDKLTVRARWNRIWGAICNPFTINPYSPECKLGITDYWWAVRQFFIGFVTDNPEQAGKCFFYTVMSIKAILLIHILCWIF